MIALGQAVTCYVYSEPVDMRKSIDGLSFLVCEALENNPQNGAVYIFHNKQRDKVKLLYWDKNGFIVHYKRLEKGRFKFYRNHGNQTTAITQRQLSWLLAGLDFMTMGQFNQLYYTDFY